MQPLITKSFRPPFQRYVNTLDYYDIPEINDINESLYQNNFERRKKFRFIIYPKDVEIIFGRSNRFARQMLLAIRRSQHLSHREPVTFKSFIRYTGIDAETLMDFVMES